MIVLKEKDVFQASLKSRTLHFGLVDDVLKVANGIDTCFLEHYMMFLLALPSWLCKTSTANSRAVYAGLQLALNG